MEKKIERTKLVNNLTCQILFDKKNQELKKEFVNINFQDALLKAGNPEANKDFKYLEEIIKFFDKLIGMGFKYNVSFDLNNK